MLHPREVPAPTKAPRAGRAARRAVQSRRPGQALVEFGIIFTILFFLISGIADFGLVLNAWISLSNSSAEIARQAAVGTPPYQLLPQVQSLTLLGNASTPTLQMSIRIKCAYPTGYGPPPLTAPTPTASCPDWATTDVWADVDVNASTPTNKYPLKAPYAGWMYTTLVPPVAPPQSSGGELFKVTLAAPQFQIVTPVVRAAFGNRESIQLSAQSVTRSEGTYFQ